MGGLSEAPTLSSGRYALTERLGEGGMATVFRAWDHKLKVWRAVKVLLPTFVRRRKLRLRFENEAHAMARLEHRHIVRVYDVGTEGEIPYMVMELAEGGSVIDWIARHGRMPSRMAIDVTVQLCKGIAQAHDAGIVHRDLKPHNILVSAQGQCKVTDFGIAQVMDQDTLTKTGSVMGTWGYMAPEQRTDAKTVDLRADVFSIGATLYTLLTGRTPTELYVADAGDEMFEGVPEGLLEVVLKATRYKPEDRYPNVERFAKALHKAGRDEPPVPPGTPSLVTTRSQLVEAPTDGSLKVARTLVEEIERALGLDTSDPGDDDGPSTDLDPPQPPASEKKVLPYYMPSVDKGRAQEVQRRRRESLPPQDQGNARPRYLDPEEFEKVQETPAPAEPSPPPPVAPDDTNEDEISEAEYWMRMIGLPSLVLVLVVVGTIGLGAVWVNGSEDHAQAQADALAATIEAELAVVEVLPKLGVHKAPIEAMYFTFADARGRERTLAALAYLDALDQALVSPGSGADSAAPALEQARISLKRMVDARADYDAAVVNWGRVSRGFPGVLAVRLGLSDAPP